MFVCGIVFFHWSLFPRLWLAMTILYPLSYQLDLEVKWHMITAFNMQDCIKLSSGEAQRSFHLFLACQ